MSLTQLTFSSAKALRARPLLGTFVEVSASGLPSAELHRAIDLAFDAVQRVHALMSFHDLSSEVCRLNLGLSGRTHNVDPWTYEVLSFALEVARESGGIFDISVADLMVKAGHLPDHGFGVVNDAIRPSYKDIELLDGNQVKFHRRLTIDLGGIAKGFAVDKAVEALKGFGVPSAVVNAGGDIRAFGKIAYPISIRHPRDRKLAAPFVEIKNQAMATSAQKLRGPSQFIDPLSGLGVESSASISVRAPSCMVADALTKICIISMPTACRILGRHEADAILVDSCGNVSLLGESSNVIQHEAHLNS